MALFRSIGAALDDDGTGTEPRDVRNGLAGLLSGPGVLPGAASPLVEGTDGFEYQVNAAHWVTSRGGSDGLHLWGNDGPITVPTDVAPGAGLSRIDVIYALHPSNGENADTTSEPLIGVAKGTAAAVPIAPSIPTGALALARNTMDSTATDTAGPGNAIEQSAPRAVVVGTGLGRHARYRATPMGVPHNESTLVGAWNGIVSRSDPLGDWSATSGTSASANFAGMARVRADVRFDTSPDGTVRMVQINRNGSPVKVARTAPLSNLPTDVVAQWEGEVSPGDTFEVLVYQNSGGTISLGTSAHAVGFIVERMS